MLEYFWRIMWCDYCSWWHIQHITALAITHYSKYREKLKKRQFSNVLFVLIRLFPVSTSVKVFLGRCPRDLLLYSFSFPSCLLLFKAPHYSVPPSILSVRGKNGMDNVSHTSVSTLLFCEGGCPCQRCEPVTVLFGKIESCLSPFVPSGCLTTLGMKTLTFYNFCFYPARPDYTTHFFFFSVSSDRVKIKS